MYKEISSQVREVFKSFTNMIEPLSIDEAYLDVTNNSRGITSATLVAHLIQKEVYEKTDLLVLACLLISFWLKWPQVIKAFWNYSDLKTHKNLFGLFNWGFMGWKVSAEKLRRGELKREKTASFIESRIRNRFGNLGPRLCTGKRNLE